MGTSYKIIVTILFLILLQPKSVKTWRLYGSTDYLYCDVCCFFFWTDLAFDMLNIYNQKSCCVARLPRARYVNLISNAMIANQEASWLNEDGLIGGTSGEVKGIHVYKEYTQLFFCLCRVYTLLNPPSQEGKSNNQVSVHCFVMHCPYTCEEHGIPGLKCITCSCLVQRFSNFLLKSHLRPSQNLKGHALIHAKSPL